LAAAPLSLEAALSAHAGRFVIVPVPNITHVFYGRDVGYVVGRIVLDDNIEAISATQLARSLGVRPTIFQVDSTGSSLVTERLGWRYQRRPNRRSIFLRPNVSWQKWNISQKGGRRWLRPNRAYAIGFNIGSVLRFGRCQS
jgi:hypothetical protein